MTEISGWRPIERGEGVGAHTPQQRLVSLRNGLDRWVGLHRLPDIGPAQEVKHRMG